MGNTNKGMKNKRIGNMGERLAKSYLLIYGYQILKCNFRTRLGEIDIIAKKEGIIHFIEVKTRTSKRIDARHSIGTVKCEHILRVAEYYLYINNINNIGCQIDAIEVYLEREGAQINHVPQIVEK